MNTPASEAAANSSMKWNMPGLCCSPLHDASTASAVMTKVSMSMMRPNPSAPRWKRMPACGIQGASRPYTKLVAEDEGTAAKRPHPW